MLRVGLVGVGDAGRHHARALAALHHEGVAVFSAVCARRVESVDALRRDVQMPAEVAAFSSLDALLDADACDAVVLATPDGLHAEQVERAAGRGLAVLVEKPLALSAEEGARAIEAARRAGVCLAVGYHLRHHEAHRIAAAQSPERVGSVRSIFIRWAWPDPATEGWRARGSMARFWSLAALGTHGLDLAMMFAGSTDISDVVAVLEPSSGADRAAEVSLRLSTKGGSAALAHVSVAVTHRAVSRVLVAGDAGEIEATGTLGARGDGDLTFRSAKKGEAPRAIPFEAKSPYEAQMRDFIRRALLGFNDDPALLTNLILLDRIGSAHPGGSP